MTDTIQARVRHAIGPWTIADSSYFDEHPDEQIYTRDPLPAEIGMMRGGPDSIQQTQVDRMDRALPQHEGASIRIAVLRIESPMVLLRLPVLVKGDRTHLIDEKGELVRVTQEDLIVLLANQVEFGDDLVRRDYCHACERKFRTADIVYHFGPPLRPIVLCEPCGFHSITHGNAERFHPVIFIEAKYRDGKLPEILRKRYRKAAQKIEKQWGKKEDAPRPA